MNFKLAIDDVIGVKVEGKTTNKDGSEKPFKFVLQCDRYNAQQMKDLASDEDATASSFLQKVASGWQGQKLVLDEDGNPAEFSAEALQVLLGISGMAMVCWDAYRDQVQVTAKN